MYLSFKSLCTIALGLAVVFSVAAQSSNQTARKPGAQSGIKKTVRNNPPQKPVSTPQQPALILLTAVFI